MKNLKKKLRTEGDKLWQQAIIKKHGKQCEICKKKDVHCHHIFPKGLYGHLRFDVENGTPLCFYCHFSRCHKGDPAIIQKIIKLRGKRWWNRLEKKSQEKPKKNYLTNGCYKDIFKKLKKYEN